jgi:hypothetical protein
MMKEEDDKRSFSELSKKERREKARKLVFGDFKDEYMGNIWGWKFSMYSFVGLVLVGSLAFYGIYTGKIDLSKAEEDAANSVLQNTNPYLQKATVNDSLKYK